MSTKFTMQKDIQGTNGFGILPTYDIQGCSLSESAAQTFTVPSNAPVWMVIFSYTPGANVFVRFDGSTATVPGGTVGSIHVVLNPAGRTLPAGATFSVITPDTDSPYITVEYQIAPFYVNQI
jgi:hypothetical protein